MVLSVRAEKTECHLDYEVLVFTNIVAHSIDNSREEVKPLRTVEGIKKTIVNLICSRFDFNMNRKIFWTGRHFNAFNWFHFSVNLRLQQFMLNLRKKPYSYFIALRSMFFSEPFTIIKLGFFQARTNEKFSWKTRKNKSLVNSFSFRCFPFVFFVLLPLSKWGVPG